MQLLHTAVAHNRLNFQMPGDGHPNLFLNLFDGKKRVRVVCSKFNVARRMYKDGYGFRR